MQTAMTSYEPAKKHAELHEKVDEAISRLADSLEAGQSDTLKAWLQTMNRFHDYSFGNQLLIAWQRPDATRVAGFHAWRKFDRFVNKGEKGIMILAPVTRVVGSAREQDDSGRVTETPLRRIVNTKVVYVFDVSQTSGEPLPEFAKVVGDPAEQLPKLKKLVADKGIRLEYMPILPHAGAFGCSLGGTICVRLGLETGQEFKTLVHELAHELLHRGERRSELTKTIKETEAEAVAFVVSDAIGLDCTTRCSDYIQLYQGDKKTLFESLQLIREVAGEILLALIPSRRTKVGGNGNV